MTFIWEGGQGKGMRERKKGWPLSGTHGGARGGQVGRAGEGAGMPVIQVTLSVLRVQVPR